MILLAYLIATPGLATETDNEFLRKAAESLNREELDLAVEQFSHAIKASGGNREQLASAYEGRCAALYKKGLLNNNKALTREAISDCNKAVEAKADHQRAYRLRGTAHLTIGDTFRALDDLNVAQSLDPQDPLTLQNRGLALARLGQIEKAIADFNHSIQIKSDNYWSYYNRGRLYSTQGRHDNAIDDFSSFIRFRRDYEPAYLHRGKSWLSTGAYQQSLVDLYESLRLKPQDNGAALFLRGVSLYLLERYDEALPDFEEVVRLDNLDAVNAMWLFLARERLGKPGGEAFAGNANLKESDQWPGIMIAYMQGRGQPESVLAATQTQEGSKRPGETENLALFFMGEMASLKKLPTGENTWFTKLLNKDKGDPWVHAAIWRTRDMSAAEVARTEPEPHQVPEATTNPVVAQVAAMPPEKPVITTQTTTTAAATPLVVDNPPTVRMNNPLSSGTPIKHNRPMYTTRPLNTIQAIQISLPTEDAVPEKSPVQTPEENAAPAAKTIKPRSPHVPGSYAFKLASFESTEHADQALAEMSGMKLPVYLQDFNVNDHSYLRVWVGPFKTENQATEAWTKVSSLPGRNPSSVRQR
ncbi:MAG: tetratricopeptide repeat protein [Magnetococcales bacterium]|nr:tetratricopeptide repeat protein [Magnetococcales bacterium]